MQVYLAKTVLDFYSRIAYNTRVGFDEVKKVLDFNWKIQYN